MGRKPMSKSAGSKKGRASKAKADQPPAGQEKLILRDGQAIMNVANEILSSCAPNIPRVRNAGQGALVVGLNHICGKTGEDLDWREHKWEIFKDGQSSMQPQDVLPFTIIASDRQYLEIREGQTANVSELASLLAELLKDPPIVNIPCPKGENRENHKLLLETVLHLEEPFAQRHIAERLKREHEIPHVSLSTVRRWLKAMESAGHFERVGQGRNTVYKLTPPSE